MAAKKTRRQLADEAFLRNEQILLGNAPNESAAPKELPVLDSVPSACPECRSQWRDDAGVVPIIRPDAEQQTAFLETIQCGGCGNRFLVDPADHEKIRVARVEYTERQRAMRAPLPKKERRVRGAE